MNKPQAYIEYLNGRKENFIKRETKQIETLELLIKALDDAKEIFKTFDNKVINKRLENKLNNDLSQNGRLTFRVWYEYSSIRFNVSAYSSKDTCYGNGNISEHTLTVYDVIFREPSLMSGGNRLNYDKTEEQIDKTINNAKERIEIIKDSIKNIDYYIEEGEKIEELIKEYEDKIPYLLRRRIVVYNFERL